VTASSRCACPDRQSLAVGGGPVRCPTSQQERTISTTAGPHEPPTTPGPEPAVLTRLRGQVDAALQVALDHALPRIEARHASMAPLTAELRAFMAGGKRIRPALLLLGFEAAGGRRLEAVEGPALALELLHTCALLHDDVIDQAPTRRGRASVHDAFAARHRTERWSGDPEAYGRAVAILLGDLAFVEADALFLSGQVPDQVLLAAFRRFTVLREEVMIGQALDLHAATARTTDRDLALQIATLKSGRYSVARPLELGAILAGADAELLAGLRAFGDPLGRAFQLADDLLGVFGDTATTGKSASSDLAEGKRTLLIAEAAARLDPQDHRQLEEVLGHPEFDTATEQRIRDLLEDCGVRAATEREIERSITSARAALAGLELPGTARASLQAVATYLGNRTS